LNMEDFPHSAFILNQPADKFIPCSGGPTTAISTGFLTNADMIALSPEGKPLKTVLEYAQEQNMATGLISTSSITDVTPACFYSHLPHRHFDNLLAEDLTSKNVDVIIGGGLAFFLPAFQAQSERPDQKDLLARLAQTHTVVRSPEEFRQAGEPAKLAAFLALEEMPTADERVISLSEMVDKAIRILSRRPEGFFLMAEGSQIDWAGHHSLGEYLIQEVVDLDDAVGVALDFARRNGDTLVIVTADHETGGLALLEGSVEEHKISAAVFLTERHTGTMVPLFAYGPGSEVFGGIQRNTYIGQKLIEYIVKSGQPTAPTHTPAE